MQKNIVKTESVAEFLARGCKITKCATRVARTTYKKIVEKPKVEEVDWSALPTSLKIKFGLR